MQSTIWIIFCIYDGEHASKFWKIGFDGFDKRNYIDIRQFER